ncbi:MAG: bifunctional glutamate N-acetyltransferase/amino-acid acetyltransferase ArgJ [Alphaproteobacteria bacterium]
MPPVAGVGLGAAASGVRYRGRDDLLFVKLAPGTSVAGVFTRSRTASAPVAWCRQALSGGRARGLVANAGNANAFTGAAGDAAVGRTAEAAARLIDCRPCEVFIASTGVIGEPLSDRRITQALPVLYRCLGPDRWEAAAGAIMTTDTFPKGATRQATLGRATVTINGIAKGSGMIAPDMATMLAFLFTDAAIPASVLQTLLARAVERSFNAITVDGDTSTSDTVLLFATGQGPRHPPVRRPGEARLKPYREALEAVCRDLAHQIVRDGEGAQRFVTITVTGAASKRAARRIGLTVANSPLVKTAIAGSDPNWGRVVAAVGNAGEKVDPRRLTIRIGGVLVAADGAVHPDYTEAAAAAHMRGRDIAIDVDVGVGRGRGVVWTCDLTHRYIDINADYRS